MLPRMAGLAVKPATTVPTTIRPVDAIFNLEVFIGLLINPELEMIILVQFFDLLYFFFCFTFVDMIKAKYILLLTHYVIGLDKLENIRTV